jgi:hypothetical protein
MGKEYEGGGGGVEYVDGGGEGDCGDGVGMRKGSMGMGSMGMNVVTSQQLVLLDLSVFGYLAFKDSFPSGAS